MDNTEAEYQERVTRATEGDEIVTSVYLTSDYDKFVEPSLQRDKHTAKKLKDSIEKWGYWIAAGAVVVKLTADDKLEIIDGGHRIRICREKNIPVSYVIERQDVGVRDFNKGRNPWDLEDALTSGVRAGLMDYKILKHFRDKYKIQLAISLRLLSNKKNTPAKNDLWDLVYRIDNYNFAKRLRRL